MVAAKSPFGCSTSSRLAIGVLVAQVGKVVLAAPLALDLAGIGVEQPRLADQVERQVGERDVLLQHGRPPRPLRQPMPEHQRVVGEGHDIVEQRRSRRIGPRAYPGFGGLVLGAAGVALIGKLCALAARAPLPLAGRGRGWGYQGLRRWCPSRLPCSRERLNSRRAISGSLAPSNSAHASRLWRPLDPCCAFRHRPRRSAASRDTRNRR